MEPTSVLPDWLGGILDALLEPNGDMREAELVEQLVTTYRAARNRAQTDAGFLANSAKRVRIVSLRPCLARRSRNHFPRPPAKCERQFVLSLP